MKKPTMEKVTPEQSLALILAKFVKLSCQKRISERDKLAMTYMAAKGMTELGRLSKELRRVI